MPGGVENRSPRTTYRGSSRHYETRRPAAWFEHSTRRIKAGTSMNQTAASFQPSSVVVFRDGLGERRRVTDSTGRESLDLLCLSGEMVAMAAFEAAVRERADRLTDFRHPSFCDLRGVERLSGGTVAVVADAVPGSRIADLLSGAVEHQLTLDINAAMCLIRQLVPAIEALHEHNRHHPRRDWRRAPHRHASRAAGRRRPRAWLGPRVPALLAPAVLEGHARRTAAVRGSAEVRRARRRNADWCRRALARPRASAHGRRVSDEAGGTRGIRVGHRQQRRPRAAQARPPLLADEGAAARFAQRIRVRFRGGRGT